MRIERQSLKVPPSPPSPPPALPPTEGKQCSAGEKEGKEKKRNEKKDWYKCSKRIVCCNFVKNFVRDRDQGEEVSSYFFWIKIFVVKKIRITVYNKEFTLIVSLMRESRVQRCNSSMINDTTSPPIVATNNGFLIIKASTVNLWRRIYRPLCNRWKVMSICSFETFFPPHLSPSSLPSF